MKSHKIIPVFLILSLLLTLLPSSVFAQGGISGETKKVIVYFFWGDGCPHCAHEKQLWDVLKKKYPELEVKAYEVWYNKKNAELFVQMTKAAGIQASGVPITFIDNKVIVGFSEYKGKEIEDKLKYCIEHGCIDPLEILSKTFKQEEAPIITLPLFGKVDTSKITLPVFTITLAGLDSFNPCAFFVLFFLLSLLMHARSRKRMFLIGGIFVFFSGFVYFLFMSAWLNIFLLIGQLLIITTIAGIIALLVALINIKDFFFFKKGISLVIPEKAKSRLFERMRNLMKSTSILSIIAGTAALAIAANTYELLCTAGFPMVFTRVLTLHNLTTLQYYFYLILYNLVYVIPLAFIVFIFTATLGAKKLTEWEGRKLKLISGLMMLGLGVVLLIKPSLLNNVLVAAGLLAIALTASGIIIFLTKKFNPDIVSV